MTLAYIGLGANLSDPRGTIAEAIRRVSQLAGVSLLRQGGLFRTAPVGGIEQPDFLNTVIEVDTRLTPEDFLRALKDIERDMGRVRTVRWGPREIDLDILLYGEERYDSPELVIPHPGLWNRLFAIAPLADLRVDLVSPEGESILAVRDRLGKEQVAERIPHHAEPLSS